MFVRLPFPAGGPIAGGSGSGLVFAAELTTTLGPWRAVGGSTPTFTRATTSYVEAYAAAAVSGASPILIQCASGEARFQGARRVSEGVWSAVLADGTAISTATLLGYLPEGARTNSGLHSRKLAAGVVAGDWIESLLIAIDDGTGVDGVANACSSLRADDNNVTILQTVTAASASKVFQPYVKRKVGTGTVEITVNGGTNWQDITANLVGGAWYWAEEARTVTNPQFGFRLGTATDEIYVDMCDLQNGTFKSTPIPTTTAGVVRNADVLTYAAAGNIDGTRGSAYAEVSVPAARVMYFTSGTTGTVLYFSGAGMVVYDGTNFSVGAAITPSADMQKIASKWSGVLSGTFVGGSAGAAKTFDGDLNLGANVTIGHAGGGADQPYAPVRNVRFYNRPLSDAQLQALTA